MQFMTGIFITVFANNVSCNFRCKDLLLKENVLGESLNQGQFSAIDCFIIKGGFMLTIKNILRF